MPRIRRLEHAEVDEQTRSLYEAMYQQRGNVPNMFRTFAHRPEIMRTMVAHMRAIMTTGTVPEKVKELVIVRTSQLNRCAY
jgi:alkylhydroperoxidase family enzyme